MMKLIRDRRKATYGSVPLGVTISKQLKMKNPISWTTIIFFVGSFSLLLISLASLFSSSSLKPIQLNLEEFTTHGDTNERYLRIEASNLYDAGFQFGFRTALRVRTYFKTDEMGELVNFVNTPAGRKTFQALKRDNSRDFPDLASEIKGIADGARVEENLVWIANMFPELTGNLPDGTHTTVKEDFFHCADIYSYDNEGNAMQAHTEDWSPEVFPLWVLIDYVPTKGASFSKCSGLAFPATLLGYSPTWNGHGMFHTQNTLLSGKNRADGGWACTLAQRYAMCGGEGSRSLEEYVSRIHEQEWASGSNLNVVDLDNNIMASVENWMHDMSVHWIPPMQNYSHLNWYQHLGSGQAIDLAGTRIENTLRQMRIHERPAPRTYEEMVDRIGDGHDLGDDFRGHRVAIHRYNTLATFVIDRSRGTLDIWDNESPMEVPPKFTWKLT